MNYGLHPDAVAEHQEQIVYYEEQQGGLGRRYHAALLAAMEVICMALRRYRVVQPPSIRRIGLQLFRFDVIYREAGDAVQVLAIAHHRRQPGYWLGRL